MIIEKLTENAISLLKSLIETQSFSQEEENTAKLIEGWFIENEIPFKRTKNNIWATNKYFDGSKPTMLLNSHHDTVHPNTAYTKDPLKAIVEDGKLYGLAQPTRRKAITRRMDEPRRECKHSRTWPE